MVQASALRYEVVEGWEQLPAGFTHPDVAGVAVDSKDRVYLYCRAEHPVLVYERDGTFVTSWGEGRFRRPRHLCGPDDMVCVETASAIRCTSTPSPSSVLRSA
jgi:hypothetical protein